jgi:hypothetical protein
MDLNEGKPCELKQLSPSAVYEFGTCARRPQRAARQRHDDKAALQVE